MRFFITSMVLLSATFGYADSIDDLLVRGELLRAERQLSGIYGRNTETPEYLFLQGKTDLSGESSASYLKDFINRSTEDTYIPDWARLILGKYYMSQGLYVTARKQLLSIPESSPFHPEAEYLAARCYMLSGEYEDAILKYRDIVGRPYQSEYSYWASLGIADAYYEIGNYREAEQVYYELLRPELDDDIYALALLGMMESARASNRPADSEKYLEIFEDRYHAGLDIAPLRKHQQVTQKSAQTAKREEKTRPGERFYIQVGAFSVKDNAIRIAGLYKESGYDVYMEPFIERGQEYYRIMIGGYNSKQQAEFIQRRLEKSMGEKFFLIKR